MHGSRRLVRLRGAPHRERAPRQAARHWHGDLYRALWRRFPGDRVDRVQGRACRARHGQNRIRHRPHHSLNTRAGHPGGSRALPVGGSALYDCSQQIIEKGRGIAAHLLEAAAADVQFAEGSFVVPGTDLELELFEVAKAARDPKRLPPGMQPGLDATKHLVPPAATFPNGCHICEVEIDPDTGAVTVERYTIVDDFGRTINPIMLEGQVHGGVVQGLGQALLEHTVYDAA